MKYAVTIFALSISFAANAAPSAKPKSAKLRGMRTVQIVEILNKVGLGDAGMGHWDLQAKSVTCTKTVADDGTGDVTCEIVSTGDEGQADKKSVITTKDGASSDDALVLRALLMEATGNDKKINAHQKQTRVTELDCRGASEGHEFDSLDIEVMGGLCTMKY